MSGDFHRFSGDYYSRAEWTEMPEDTRRIRRALGPEPLARVEHLLQPIAIPPPPKPLGAGPRPGVSLLADIADSAPLTREVVRLALAEYSARENLDGATLWGFAQGSWHRVGLDGSLPSEFSALTVAWPLLELPGQSLAALTQEAKARLVAATRLAETLGARVTRADDPVLAAQRTATLVQLKQRFARSVELRLGSATQPWSSRLIWRTLYSLGFQWGNLDLFHWQRLFTVASLAKPGYFLPERAVEGEMVPGLSLSFELPSCPAPIETFERMALTLAYLRETIGGRPQTVGGLELDSERLDAERDAVVRAVAAMESAGIAPGSAEAAAFF